MSDKFQDRYQIPTTRAIWWDYGRNAAYFVTICTQDRECYFGDIIEKQFVASPIGEIAHSCWIEIPQHFPYVQLDSFVLMPNHFHGIIIIDKRDEIIIENEMSINDINESKNVAINEMTTNAHVETRLIASLPNCNPNTIPSKLIGRITGNKNPMLNDYLSRIVRWYKGRIAFESHKINPGFEWQGRFYDSIIRNEKSHQIISEYITNNPANWNDDKFYNE